MNNTSLKITYGYYVAFISLGLMLGVLGPTLPDLARQTNSRLSEIGFLFTVRSIGGLLGTFLVGYLYDRRAGHPIIIASLLLMGMTLAFTPFTPYLVLLTGIFLLMGISEAGINVGGNTLIVWVHGAKVTPYMNGLHFFFGVGFFLCPIIVAEVVRASGEITAAYGILAVLMLPAALMLFRLPSPVDRTREQEIAIPTNTTLVFLIALFFFFMAGGNYAFGGWLVTYATELNLADETTARYMLSAYSAAVTVGRLVAIPIATYIRPRTILIVDLVGMFLSAFFLIVFKTDWALWVGAVTMGLAAASVFPTMMSYAGALLNLSANVTSWFMVGVSLGGMFLPLAIGYIFDAGNPDWMMPILAMNLVIVIGLFLSLNAYAERPANEVIPA